MSHFLFPFSSQGQTYGEKELSASKKPLSLLPSAKQKVPSHCFTLFLTHFELEAGHDLSGGDKQKLLNASLVGKSFFGKI